MTCPSCGAKVDERFQPFRFIDWKTNGLATIETDVSALDDRRRAAFLQALNAFVAELNKEAVPE